MATAKSSPAQRYRPASEFDNATLTKKREYWRTKKREQRAKVAAIRKKLGAENSSVCDVRQNTFGAHVQNAAPTPMLLSSDGSNHTNAGGPSKSEPLAFSSRGRRDRTGGVRDVPISGSSPQQCSPTQKVRWFQRVKLNKVLPKFPDQSSTLQCSAMGYKRVDTTGPRNTFAKSSRSLQNTSAPVSAVHLTVHSATTLNQRTPSRTTATNGTSVKGYSQSLPPKDGRGNNDHKRPKVRVQIPHKAMPSGVTNKVDVDVKQCLTRVCGDNIKTKPCALVPKMSSTPDGQTADTEEQKAAKRREIWRIKKREQRAKRAANLASERERTQRMDGQGTVQTPCGTPNRLRILRQGQAVSRTRLPYSPAIQLQNQRQRQIHALALSGPSQKSTHNAIRNKTDGPLLSSHIVIDPEPPSVVKTGDPKQMKTFYTPSEATATCVVSNNMNVEQGFTRATAQFSNTARSTVHPRLHTNTFARTQRFLVHRNTRMPFMSFHENPEETAEQRMARKREYWRIKKREQRAKLSAEVKAKLRERDSLQRRVKRYQSILEEMRQARAESQKVQQVRRNAVSNSTEPIGGFIREDGTVTISMQTTSSGKDTITGAGRVFTSNPLSPIAHCKVSTNRGSNSFHGHFKNPPLLQKQRVQLKSSYPIKVSVQTPPRLVCVKPKPVINSLHNKFTNSSPISSQITVSASDQRQDVVNETRTFRKLGTKQGGIVPVAAEPSPGEELTEEERIARRREYWRIRKREQRAKRAARLRQGLLRGRAMAARRRRQNHIQVQNNFQTHSVSLPISVSETTTITSSVSANPPATPPAPPSICIPVPAESVKQEQEFPVKKELNNPSEQPLCNDIKPSLGADPELTSEVDQSGSADTQATTLLAVASMKKLLEESLSTVVSSDTPETSSTVEVSQCKTEQEPMVVEGLTAPDIKPNAVLDVEGLTAPDIKPNAVLDVEGLTTPDIKPNAVLDAVEEAAEVEIPESICFSADDATHPQTNENSGCQTLQSSPPLLPSPHFSQDTPPFIDPSSCPDISDVSASLMPASFCPPHQPPCTSTSPLVSAQTALGLCATRSKLQPSSCMLKSLSPQAEGANESSILQRKREYWRVMKRQQRARKAQEKQRMQPGKPATKAPQAPDVVCGTQRPCQGSYPKASLPLNNSASSGCTLKGKPYGGTVNSMPAGRVMRPAASSTKQQQSFHQYGPLSEAPLMTQRSAQPGCPPRSTTQSLPSYGGAPVQPFRSRVVPLHGPSVQKNGPLRLVEPHQDVAPDHRLGVRRWCLREQSDTSAASSSSLTASLPSNRPHQPIAMTAPPPIRIPVKPPGALGPCKRTQGAVEEEEEDVMRRKREYWRVKKKEQRARKAERERGLAHLDLSSEWEPVLPAQNQLPHNEQSQVSRQWLKTEDTDLAVSSPVGTDLCHPTELGMHCNPVKEEAELLIKTEDQDAINASPWWSRYLMDYDPLNQLLVCMVCGEQRYCEGPEGARAHAEEAHPHTLSMDLLQRSQLQQAWEEQVAQREQFFSSQLQQHTATDSTTQSDSVAEVEVTVEMDDSSQSLYRTSAKSKLQRKL